MLYFATSNRHKFREAQEILQACGIPLRHLRFQHREIRSEDPEAIAREAVAAAYSRCRQPVFVDDSGLFIRALQGFPGTYSGWVLQKIGCDGLLRLMHGIRRREAYFQTSIALHTGRRIRIFTGRCPGRIARRAQGKNGFGYDPLFIPRGHRLTFGQSIPLKNKLSHRFNSLKQLVSYLKTR